MVLVEQRTQLELWVQAMDLRAQIVQQAYRHAAPDQCPRKRQPDEPESSGNQDLLGHPMILTFLVSIAPVSIRLEFRSPAAKRHPFNTMRYRSRVRRALWLQSKSLTCWAPSLRFMARPWSSARIDGRHRERSSASAAS